VGLLRLSLKDESYDSPRLAAAAAATKSRLYVAMEGDWSTQARGSIQKRLLSIYDTLHNHHPTLDSRVLLPSPGMCIARNVREIDAVLSAPAESEAVDALLRQRSSQGLHQLENLHVDAPCPDSLRELCWDESVCVRVPEGVFDNVVLGGTFDRIHAGHKLLLAMSCLSTRQRLLIGVSDGPLLEEKTLKEALSSLEGRKERLRNYLESTCPGIKYEIVPIVDPFGPSIVDKDLQCIVVSKETEKGGASVNKRRIAAGLSELKIQVVDLVGPEDGDESTKVSSTLLRKQVLGRFCGEGIPTGLLEGGQEGSRGWVRLTRKGDMPYVVGLTGGIAAGKSTISEMLAAHGAAVLDCDKLGHKAYVKGGETFAKLVSAFGNEIIDATSGEIDRKALGGVVFGNAARMKDLTDIVWPAIRSLAGEELARMGREGVSVCVMEAAVLLEAGWDDMVDEIWVVVVPENVAKERLMERNKLSEEDALKRIRSQLTNDQRLAKAHIVLGNQWGREESKKQVDQAWAGIMGRSNCIMPTGIAGGGLGGGGLAERWSSACDALKVPSSKCVAWYRRLWASYTGKGRFYHTLSHLRHMLSVLDGQQKRVQRPELVCMAVFFHDVIYVPTRGDNEEQSAALFRDFSADVGCISKDDVETVAAWILHTAEHHKETAEGDRALFLDSDLAVLALSPSRYATYAEKIRREYAHKPNLEYLEGRFAVLSRMAQLPTLYHDPELAREMQPRAKANLDGELKALAALRALYQ